jgi:hypothetical protein
MGEFDGFSGITARPGSGGQSDGMRAPSDGVIGADHALIGQAEAAVEIEAAGQAADVTSCPGGRTGKAMVVTGAKLLQHGVGFSQVGGPGEAQFADQRSWQGDRFSLQLGADIILEHLHKSSCLLRRPLPAC